MSICTGLRVVAQEIQHQIVSTREALDVKLGDELSRISRESDGKHRDNSERILSTINALEVRGSERFHLLNLIGLLVSVRWCDTSGGEREI